MKTIRLWGVSLITTLMVWGLMACSGDDKPFVDNEPIAVKDIGESDVVKGISVTLSDFESADSKTRTAYSVIDGGMKVTWAAGDTIGIFPNEGGQVEFPIQAGTESNQAEFDGGGWALKSNSTYAAYYPYYYKNSIFGNKRIQLDYTGQTQIANGSTSHLGQYDYQATGGVKTNSEGFLNFQFKHLGALMVFHLTVPKAGVYTSLTLNSTEKVFVTKAELDISGSDPVLIPIETSNSFTLQLDNIKLASDKSQLNAYVMLAHTDLSKGLLELSLNGSKDYLTKLSGHIIEAGKQYDINPTFEGNNQSDVFIDFADKNVKEICVQYFDTDGNGEISYVEAANVNSIPTVNNSDGERFSVFSFYGEDAKKIYFFNELQYFTSLMVIPDGMFSNQNELIEVTLPNNVSYIDSEAFYHCSSLTTSIVIPEDMKYIGDRTFCGCSSLTSIKIPNGVTTIYVDAFSGCSSLTSIVLPKELTHIDSSVFAGCSSLTNITIPEGVTTIEDGTFYNCSSLTNILIPEGVTSIGDLAFYKCSSLTSITCLATNPPTYSSIFGERLGYYYSGNIYVPASSVEAYKAAHGWSNYADRIHAIPE